MKRVYIITLFPVLISGCVDSTPEQNSTTPNVGKQSNFSMKQTKGNDYAKITDVTWKGTDATSLCHAVRINIEEAMQSLSPTPSQSDINAAKQSACVSKQVRHYKQSVYDIIYDVAVIRVPSSRTNESNLYVLVTSTQGFAGRGASYVGEANNDVRNSRIKNLLQAEVGFSLEGLDNNLLVTMVDKKTLPSQDLDVSQGSSSTFKIGGSVGMDGIKPSAMLDLGYESASSYEITTQYFDRIQEFPIPVNGQYNKIMTRLLPNADEQHFYTLRDTVKNGYGTGSTSKTLKGWNPDLSTMYQIEGVDENKASNFKFIINTKSSTLEALAQQKCFSWGGVAGVTCNGWKKEEFFYTASNHVIDNSIINITAMPSSLSGMQISIN
ncbi:hypothetical protein [Chromobacterium amazonense]|uniref:hypothetical protein n=1 Tax=Chromobacterium amazonense TaxID=1382803 RepID=UPI0011B1D7C4|nr:hypothetical protein [Chromobacterium amazonense]